MRAYIFIDATKKTARKITSELREKPEVLIADVVNGPHSVIACIEAENPASMAQAILFDIRNIDGVKDLTVYLSMDGEDNRKMDDALTNSLLPDFSDSIVGTTAYNRRKRGKKSDDN